MPSVWESHSPADFNVPATPFYFSSSLKGVLFCFPNSSQNGHFFLSTKLPGSQLFCSMVGSADATVSQGVGAAAAW